MRTQAIRLLKVVVLILVLAWAPGGGLVLGQNETTERFQELQRQANDDSADIRRKAARELAIFREKAAPALIKLLDDPDAGVRREALEAMRTSAACLALAPEYGTRGPSWTGKYFQESFGARMGELTARLKKLRTSDDGKVRAAAEQILHRLKGRAAAARLKLREGRGRPLTTRPAVKAKGQEREGPDARGIPPGGLGRGGSETVSCQAFSPDGCLVAVGFRYDSVGKRGPAADGTIRGYLRIYDASTGERVGEAGSTFGPVTHLAFTEDGSTLLFQTGKYEEHGGR